MSEAPGKSPMTTYTEQELVNFQEVGAAPSASDANWQLAQARNNTPLELRGQFRSYIRWESGCWAWGWVLR